LNGNLSNYFTSVEGAHRCNPMVRVLLLTRTRGVGRAAK